jgi:hypothetical protein
MGASLERWQLDLAVFSLLSAHQDRNFKPRRQPEVTKELFDSRREPDQDRVETHRVATHRVENA